MTARKPFDIRIADWSRDGSAIRHIRQVVFIDEQQVPVVDEWDGRDGDAVHLLAEAEDGLAVGTARLLPEGKVGRMAVLKDWRGRGVASALMHLAIDRARENGWARIELDAQVQALQFYRRFGFEAEGEVFDDAGIPHRKMRLDLRRPSPDQSQPRE